jgi:hypothetical protein
MILTLGGARLFAGALIAQPTQTEANLDSAKPLVDRLPKAVDAGDLKEAEKASGAVQASSLGENTVHHTIGEPGMAGAEPGQSRIPTPVRR